MALILPILINWVLGQDDPALGVAERERALQHFSPSVVAAQYVRLYERLLGRV
jgi:hypothetical protein